MKTQIHELRIRLDGLAQLVKSIGKPFLIIDESAIPAGRSIDEILGEWENSRTIVLKHTQIIPPVFFDGSCLGESYKSLLLAKAWLGKVLAELGEETPYKNDGSRKIVEDIEPTADKSTVIDAITKFPEITNTINGFDWPESSYIEKIDWLREEIQKCSGSVFDFKEKYLTFKSMSYRGNIASTKSFEHLTEAGFHLGFELQRIKEQSK